MSVSQSILFVLMILTAIMVFLTYSPVDATNFWIYWCTAFVFVAFGYLVDVLFCAHMTFVFDPNIENWKRKTDPQR